MPTPFCSHKAIEVKGYATLISKRGGAQMSLTLLRGRGAHTPGAPIPASRCIQITGVGVHSSGASFPYIQSEMAENAPTIVVSFVGWWPTLEGSQSFRPKLWRSFLMW